MTRHLAIPLLLLMLALALTSRDVAAKPFDPSGADWEGLSDFVQIARDEVGDTRAFVTGRLDYHDLKREDGVILLHPERTLDTTALGAFMKAGGRVVMLDDFGTGEALLQHFSIQRVPLPRHPAEALRNNPQLAIAEPAGVHQVVHDVTRVVTNHATGLAHPKLSPVLKVKGVNEPDVLVAMAGAVEQGRFLAVGDPSIVINSMLRYPGNRAFARALVRYVTDDDTWGRRQGRVFILVNDFEQRGSFGDEGLSDDINDWKRSILDALDGIRREGMPPLASYIASILVGLAVIVWVGARAGKVHRAIVPRFTRDIPLVAQGGVAGHAAVIGASGTSRVLAMLEIKSALEEDLCGMLDLDHNPPHDVLMQKVASAGLLDAVGMARLKGILGRLARAETAMMSQSPNAVQRIVDRDVVRMGEDVRALREVLHAAHQRGSIERSAE